MLHDDKELEVREAAVSSQGLLMGFISDPDKYQQVRNFCIDVDFKKISRQEKSVQNYPVGKE